MPKSAKVTIERGVAFFDDGSEVSGVSIDLIKLAPRMAGMLKTLAEDYRYLLDDTDHGLTKADADALYELVGDLPE